MFEFSFMEKMYCIKLHLNSSPVYIPNYLYPTPNFSVLLGCRGQVGKVDTYHSASFDMHRVSALKSISATPDGCIVHDQTGSRFNYI